MTTPPLDEYLTRLKGVTQSGDGYKALCPAHDDRNPSLSIRQGHNGRPLLYCHAGCSYETIIAAMGLERSAPGPTAAARQIVATYDYDDESGTLRYQKVRYAPKDFRIRRSDGNGGWDWSKGKARPVLYRLPELLTAKAQGQPLFMVEGEKDADRLHSVGLTATTNVEGASEPGKRPKWRREYSEQLEGASRVVLLSDNDPPGKAHAEHIARQLAGKVADIRLVALPGLPPKGDVSDWLNAGHTVAELLQVVEATEPYQPDQGNGPDYAPPSDYSGYPEAQGDARQGRQEAKEAPADEQSINYRQVSEIQALPLDWLWYPYFLRRANNLLAGDSDTGKSKTLASMISIVTNGGRLPGTAVEIPPGNVIILAAEEDAATMLKPALLAAGADCSRVYLVESCAEYDAKGRMRKRLVTLEKDIESLITLGRKIGNLSLTMVDPITSYLGTRISGNDNTAIRSVLSGLQDLAEDTGHANILVTHPGKDNSRSAKLQILGATAFVAGVRSAIGVFRDPEDEAGLRRVMVPIKCNLVPESDRFGIAFEIHGVDVQDGKMLIPNVGAVNWIPGRVNTTADEMLAQQRAKQEETSRKEKGTSAQRQRVIDVLRAAEKPLSARRIAEILEGEEIPSNSDKRRVRVRFLLTRMLQDKQVTQDRNELYTAAKTAIEGEYVPF